MALYIKKGWGFDVGADFARAPCDLELTPNVDDGRAIWGYIEGLNNPQVPVIGRPGRLSVHVRKDAVEER